MRYQLQKLVGRPLATRCIVGLIPADGALKVWPCDLGPSVELVLVRKIIEEKNIQQGDYEKSEFVKTA